MYMKQKATWARKGNMIATVVLAHSGAVSDLPGTQVAAPSQSVSA